MTSVLVDSNILLDIFHGGAASEWSRLIIVDVGRASDLLINPIIWAEIAGGFSSEADLSAALAGLPIQRAALPYEAAFLAGKAHVAYRAQGGSRERTLPDFLIGAHAVVAGHSLLTRDAARYRTYFPNVSIIAPDTHP